MPSQPVSATQLPALQGEAATLRGRLDTLAQETDELLTLRRRGYLRPDALERQLAQIATEEADLNAQVAELERRLAQASKAPSEVEEARALLSRLRGVIRRPLDDAARRAIIVELVERIVILPDGRARVTYKFFPQSSDFTRTLTNAEAYVSLIAPPVITARKTAG